MTRNLKAYQLCKQGKIIDALWLTTKRMVMEFPFWSRLSQKNNGICKDVNLIGSLNNERMGPELVSNGLYLVEFFQ